MRAGRAALAVWFCAALVLAAGCHRNNLTSGYGVAWVTLTDSPGDFTSYIVNVDSITLTRSDGAVVTALGTVETVDFAKLGSFAELWGSATIPIGQYTSATVILDYTNAVISLDVNGVPQKATVVDSSNAAVTTQTIHVILDPAAPLTVAPTYATTAAQRLALDFNVAASTVAVNSSTSPATVTVKPYLTAGIAAPDNKLIRVRGPLINSSVDLGTYTVYIRPFFDAVDNLGSLTLFTDAATIFSINGVVTSGTAGITQLSQSSAGTTVTAAYTTYEPTATPGATAGKYHVKYLVAGSTLEDNYTQGIEGDVIARNGNTLTLRGSTTQFNNGTSTYNEGDAQVVLGPATTVTADDSITTGFSAQSVGVGQHIAARGIYSLPSSAVVTVDATGNSSTNTGSVRLLRTNLWGPLVAAGAGSLTLALQTIDQWPVADFAFAGNGTSTATDPTAGAFSVATGSLGIPDTTPGDPLWIDGIVAPFGAAPPAFDAYSVNDEATVQTVGAAAGALTCGQGSLGCVPASLRVYWTGGTTAPFSELTATDMIIDLANPAFNSGSIVIGPEAIDLKSLSASPTIVPQAGTGAAGVPPTFTPLFSFGDPAAVAPAGISVFSAFSSFAAGIPAALAAAPAVQLEARGTYDRATNTFSAISVAVVL